MASFIKLACEKYFNGDQCGLGFLARLLISSIQQATAIK